MEVVAKIPSKENQKISKPPQASATLGHLIPSYKWESNSCWLDGSLEVLWNTLLPDFENFSNCFSHAHHFDIQQEPLYALFRMLQLRRDLYMAESPNHTVEVLTAQRNTFRENLVASGILTAAALTGFEAITVSSPHILCYFYSKTIIIALVCQHGDQITEICCPRCVFQGTVISSRVLPGLQELLRGSVTSVNSTSLRHNTPPYSPRRFSTR